MRIDRLDLLAYGSFTDKSLDLSGGDAGLHFIYGDNEAGKSTSLRALTYWLFGIPTVMNDNYLHMNPKLRIGGKLRLSGGSEIEFVRRKGTKNTLLEPDTDRVLNESELLSFLPDGMDENLFKKMYGVDHGRLVSGGKELLEQSGDVGQALFSAAAGTAGLRDILSDLQSEAEALYRPRASTKFVNRAISNFKTAKKQIRELSLPVAEWEKLQKELADNFMTLQQVEERISAKSKEKSRLDRLDRVKGALAERRGVIKQIEESGDVLVLPEDFHDRSKLAKNNLKNANEIKIKAKTKLSRLKKELETLNVRIELLENEALILGIHKELGAVETALKDRPQQDGKRRMLRNEAEQLLKGVRPDLNIDESDHLRPLINHKKWIFDLAQKHSLLNQKKENAAALMNDIENKQRILKKESDDLTVSHPDLNQLKAEIASANKTGDLEKRLADSQKRFLDEKAACKSEFSRLGRFSGTIEELSKLAIPLPETLDIFENQFDELSGKIKDFNRRQKELSNDWKQAQQDLKALLLTGRVPTISELEAVRSIRNTGWNLIKQKFIEKIDVEKDMEELTSGTDLSKAYEQKVDEADLVSDQLRLAADKVIKRADLESKIERFQSRQTDIELEIRKSDKNKEAFQKKWQSVWQPLGVRPGTPREMKQWLLKVDKLLSNVRAADTIFREAENLNTVCETVKTSVSVQINKFDDSINLQGMTLEAMINLCELRIERQETALEQKRQLEHSLSDLENRIVKLREELISVKDDQADWAIEWARAIDGLGLKPDAHPAQATESFDQLLKFFDKFDKSEDLRRRIYGIDQVAEKFEKKVFELTDSLGFKRGNQDAASIAAKLNRDLNEAREARAAFQKIDRQKIEIKAEIEDADIAIQTARETLAALRTMAGVETDDELETAFQRSQRMRELQQKKNILEQELMRNGDGLSIRQLEKEAIDSDIDAIEGELEKVLFGLKELQATRDILRDQRQTLKNEIQAKNGSAIAANASEEAEQQLASIVSGVEQYLRLKIAALILEKRIEDYRQENQAPVLARAGEFFSRLTLGGYSNLRDELDKKGKPILLGVRPNNDEVPVRAMSDGTRDQLYLSLRLATLEQHMSKGEPMPVVVDDILIGFDDNRTKACLEVLAELALQTQVLLFTHHRRVLEISGELETTAGVFKYELG